MSRMWSVGLMCGRRKAASDSAVRVRWVLRVLSEWPWEYVGVLEDAIMFCCQYFSYMVFRCYGSLHILLYLCQS